MNSNKQHTKNLVTRGQQIGKGRKLLLMIHGRGGSAEDMLSLSEHLDLNAFALIAPQATGHTWYPYSFMAPAQQNEPWLSSALAMLQEIVSDAVQAGILEEDIYFLGFSQGACLTLEFVTRHAKKYGGVVAFTGGLIGDAINQAHYKGNFEGTPIFIGSSNPDPHVPVQRVEETKAILEGMQANVTVKIYNGMGHTINGDEITEAKKILSSG